ncbi:hypothetical protein SPHV1_910005 [Novosphingobium sp. KN65.2]|nr:hypothetical protein SPHV1_910005 [Novosphingobium sp. KN65.2]
MDMCRFMVIHKDDIAQAMGSIDESHSYK